MAMIITQVITKEIKGSFKTHVEDIIKVMCIANLAAEAMDMLEGISVHVDVAGVTLEGIIIINTSNITPTMKIKLLNNMVLLVPYAAATTTPPNIAKRENMILIT